MDHQKKEEVKEAKIEKKPAEKVQQQPAAEVKEDSKHEEEKPRTFWENFVGMFKHIGVLIKRWFGHMDSEQKKPKREEDFKR